MSSANDTPLVEYRPVVRFPHYRVGADGSVWSRRTRGGWKQLRPHPVKAGYLYVNLQPPTRPAKTKGHRVNRLVLEAFVGPCPPGMEGCHNNGNRSDNRLSNLRWDTHEANMADAIREGTMRRGSDQPHAKLDEQHIPTIRRLAAQGVPRRTIAARYGVSHGAINKVVRGKSWRHA